MATLVKSRLFSHTSIAGVASIISSASHPAQQPGSLHGAEDFVSTALWTIGLGGYLSYRISGIVSTKRGVLLAYSSARNFIRSGVVGYNDLAVSPDKNIYMLYKESASKHSETNNVHTMMREFPVDRLIKGHPQS